MRRASERVHLWPLTHFSPHRISLTSPFRKRSAALRRKTEPISFHFPFFLQNNEFPVRLAFHCGHSKKEKRKKCHPLTKDVSADGPAEEPGVVLLSPRPRASPVPAAVRLLARAHICFRRRGSDSASGFSCTPAIPERESWFRKLEASTLQVFE